MKLTVAVTGLNATDNPAPGLAVISSLRQAPEFKGSIIGLAYDALDTGIYDRDLLDAVYMIPYPTEGEGNLLSRLRAIHQKRPIDVIVPTLDAELTNFSALKGDLEKLGIKVWVPGEQQIRMRSKHMLYQFCLENQFPVPRTVVVRDPNQLRQVARDLGLPFIVKAIFYGAHLCHTVEDGTVYFNKLKNQWGLPIIVQECLSGEEYDVVSLGASGGKAVGAVSMRKLRITEKGTAWAAVTIRDEELLGLTRAIMEKLSWVGPIEVEFLKDHMTRRFSVIEINPRFPSWVYLATAAGQNLPLATVKLAMGEKVEPMDAYQVGLTFVRHAVDLVCPMDYLEQLATRGELIYREGLVRNGHKVQKERVLRKAHNRKT